MTIKKRSIVYTIFFITIALIVSLIYHYKGKISAIILPFFIALVIAYLLNPIIVRLEARKVPRIYGIFLIYTVSSIIIIAITIFIVPEIINNTKELMVTIPEITSKYQGIFNNFMSGIKSSNWPPDVKNAIYREIQNSAIMAQNFIMDMLKKSISTLLETLTMIFDVILAMIIAYYFIKDVEFFKSSVLSITPRKWRNGIVATGRDIHNILSSFIRGQILTAMIIGILEMIGLSIVGIKYPLILGLIGGAANIIPYFGPIIGAIPAVAIALIDSHLKVIWTVIVFVIIQQIDNAFISPKIIEGGLGLHPVTTILAVLVGGEFFGILGMLLAVPAAAILKVIARRVVEAIV